MATAGASQQRDDAGPSGLRAFAGIAFTVLMTQGVRSALGPAQKHLTENGITIDWATFDWPQAIRFADFLLAAAVFGVVEYLVLTVASQRSKDELGWELADVSGAIATGLGFSVLGDVLDAQGSASAFRREAWVAVSGVILVITFLWTITVWLRVRRRPLYAKWLVVATAAALVVIMLDSWLLHFPEPVLEVLLLVAILTGGTIGVLAFWKDRTAPPPTTPPPVVPVTTPPTTTPPATPPPALP